MPLHFPKHLPRRLAKRLINPLKIFLVLLREKSGQKVFDGPLAGQGHRTLQKSSIDLHILHHHTIDLAAGLPVLVQLLEYRMPLRLALGKLCSPVASSRSLSAQRLERGDMYVVEVLFFTPLADRRTPVSRQDATYK
jgi:hypothetical protein